MNIAALSLAVSEDNVEIVKILLNNQKIDVNVRWI